MMPMKNILQNLEKYGYVCGSEVKTFVERGKSPNSYKDLLKLSSLN